MGACLDTGATRTVIGRRQALAYARMTGKPLVLKPAKASNFLFGGVLSPSLGTLAIRVPISTDYYALLRVDVINLDIPFLLGLDVLDALGLYVNTVENKLKCDKRDIATGLVRKDNHVYLEWGHVTYYTTTELNRLHRHFNHPHPDRLSALLRRANDGKIEASTSAELERLTAACDVCQRLAKAPGRFRVAMPNEDVVFNRVVLMDLMYLDGRSVLHAIDKDTLFSAAAFTCGEKLEELWQLYLHTWVHPYVGHPQVLHVDQAPQFKSPAWRALNTSASTELVLSGVESHNALGVGERYHAFLRAIYRKVRAEHPGVPQEAALSIAVAAMNQTAGPRGLVPTLLVFGVIPRTPVTTRLLPDQSNRMEAMVKARNEMQALVAKTRLRVALSAPVPAAADRAVSPGDKVLAYREHPQDEWVGPFALVAQHDKIVWLAVDGVLKQFSIDKIKRYVPPVATTAVESPTTGDAAAPAVTSEGDGRGAPVTDGSAAGDGAVGGPTPAAATSSTEATAPVDTTTPPVAVPTPDPPPVVSTPPAAPGGPPREPSGVAHDPNADLGQLLDAVVTGEAFLSNARARCRGFVSRLPRTSLRPAEILASSTSRASRAASPTTVGRLATCGLAQATGIAHGRAGSGILRRPAGRVNAPMAANDIDSATPIKEYLTMIVPEGDPRIQTARFQAAALKEANGLQDRGTFKRVKKKDLPEGANVIGGRFVYTLKNYSTPEEFTKARFVAQGHRDRAKEFVVHNLATLRQRSTRLLVSTAANASLRLFSHDITQAYLQSGEKFSRQLYLRPRPSDMHLFDLEPDELLRIELPLYGVCDAGDYWDATFRAHIDEDLKMTPLTSDPALFFKRGDKGQLSGILGAYVDDCCMGGDLSFQAECDAMLDKFEGKKVWDNMEFAGVRVSTAKDKEYRYELDQVPYVKNLKPLPMDASFAQFASARASLAWLGHTRPDLCCGINKLAQVSEATYGSTAIKFYKRLKKKAEANQAMTLKYPRLDVSTLHLRAYADSSFANNYDSSSQMGFIILLCDSTGRAHVLNFASRKCKRVVRSVMAGEVYAFSTAFDEAFVLRYDLEQLYGRRIPLSLFTDSKQLFDVVTKATHPTEKRLMVDIAAARQAYNRYDISNVGLIASEDNPADPLTKENGCHALDTLLRTGMDHTPVAQWVIRPSVDPPCLATGDRAV